MGEALRPYVSLTLDSDLNIGSSLLCIGHGANSSVHSLAARIAQQLSPMSQRSKIKDNTTIQVICNLEAGSKVIDSSDLQSEKRD
jgi:hypothetical protein